MSEPNTPAPGGNPADAAAAAAAKPVDGAAQTPEQIAAAAAADKPLTKAEHEAAVAKAVADEAAKYKAPEKYEAFKLPETIKADDPALGNFGKLAQEIGLKQEGAQKLLDFYAGQVNALRTAHAAEGDKLLNAWKEAAKTDKEIGGADFDKNLGKAASVIAKFGSPELKAIMDATGFGSHPELIRAFVRVANAVGEDSLKIPQAGGGGVQPQTAEATAHRLFTTMAPKS